MVCNVNAFATIGNAFAMTSNNKYNFNGITMQYNCMNIADKKSNAEW